MTHQDISNLRCHKCGEVMVDLTITSYFSIRISGYKP